jgi:hypothetical protein
MPIPAADLNQKKLVDIAPMLPSVVVVPVLMAWMFYGIFSSSGVPAVHYSPSYSIRYCRTGALSPFLHS